MNSLSPLDSTTLAAIFRGAGQPVELCRVPTPEPRAGEAVVRIECCTLCGSDLHTISGKRDEPVPSVLGHETVGIVESVGSPGLCDPDGRELQPGDRITWSVAVSCGECDRCRKGIPQKCRSLSKYGHERCEGNNALSGGLAERILLRRGTAVAPISPDLPAEVICPASCATATVAAAYRIARPVKGRSVLIFGAGMLGLTAAAMAKSARAERVTVCDIDPVRLDRAKAFGADAAVEWSDEPGQLAGGEGFNLVLELSGSPDAVETAWRTVAIGGEVILVGSVMKSRAVSIDPEQVVRRCLSIHGVHNYAPQDLKTAVEFLSENYSTYPFEKLVQRSYPLAEINRAVETALQENPVRVAVRP